MFTGLVEEIGEVIAFTPGKSGGRLQLNARTVASGITLGASVAVNGCCLTVVEAGKGALSFDVLEETRRLTNLGDVKPGDGVNLEASLRAGGALGGHFVTGHIDGLGTIEAIEVNGTDRLFRIRTPKGAGRLLVHKGSIAVDGVSLTVAETQGDSFGVWLIPHTLAETNLGTRKVGQRVNLEFDLLGKYVEKLLATRS